MTEYRYVDSPCERCGGDGVVIGPVGDSCPRCQGHSGPVLVSAEPVMKSPAAFGDIVDDRDREEYLRWRWRRDSSKCGTCDGQRFVPGDGCDPSDDDYDPGHTCYDCRDGRVLVVRHCRECDHEHGESYGGSCPRCDCEERGDAAMTRTVGMRRATQREVEATATWDCSIGCNGITPHGPGCVVTAGPTYDPARLWIAAVIG